jgi:hypothetical protein
MGRASSTIDFRGILLDGMGIPFSWRKFLGDLTYEWVGFETDLERPMVGISEKARHIGGGLVPEEVGSHLSLDVGSDGGLSRLVFATQAVEHVKPLGGSLFALTAAVPSGLFVELPLRVRLTF